MRHNLRMCQQQPLKTCKRCESTKSIEDFTLARARKDGRNPYCKSCTREIGRAYNATHKEQTAARTKKWREDNLERAKAKDAAWRAANRDKSAAYSAAWRARNPGGQAAADKAWYERNRERKLQSDRVKRLANLDLYLQRERESYARNREARSARGKRWREANKHRVAYHASLRRKAVADRTPSWLTEEDFAAIDRFFYKAARMTQIVGVPYHVDHIVPLRGKLVSGLNVPWNLQVLPATENLKKNNQYAVA